MNIKVIRIINIVLPIGVYYVITGIVYYLMEGFVTSGDASYMLRQTVACAVTVPFMWRYFAADTKRLKDTGRYGRSPGLKELIADGTLAVIAAAFLGAALNNILAMTPLMEVSQGFAEANQAFFGGKVIFELLGSCLIIPVSEELLYRGVVYRRVRALLLNAEVAAEDAVSVAIVPAMFISGAIFGLVHANLVQFLYAALLGVLLAFLLEKTNCIYICILAHIAANLVAVLRESTGFLAFAYEPTAAGIAATAAMCLVGGAAVWYLVRQYRRRRER